MMKGSDRIGQLVARRLKNDALPVGRPICLGVLSAIGELPDFSQMRGLPSAPVTKRMYSKVSLQATIVSYVLAYVLARG